jgi:hypothetical protein
LENSKLTYIGHSEGTTQAFAGFLDPEFEVSSKVNLFVAMAPVAYSAHFQSVLLRTLADIDADDIFSILG